MSLAHPFYLHFLWLVPLLVLAFLAGHRRRRRIQAGFAEPAAFARITLGVSGARRAVAAGLLVAAVGLSTLALAGPFLGYRERIVERRGVDVILALDLSRSMLAADVSPNRLERARRKIIDLSKRSGGDRLGLVAFAGTAFLQCPLTTDLSGLELFLRSLHPDDMPIGGTAIADAVDVAVRSFDPQSPAGRAIVLITDGEPTSGDLRDAAEKARQAGVPVYVLGVGTPSGASVPARESGFVKSGRESLVLSRLDEEGLKRLAESTGGTYARSVADDRDWDLIYDQGVRGRLEAGRIGEEKSRIPEDRYQWPLALAAIFLIIEITLPLRGRKLFRRPPDRDGKLFRIIPCVALFLVLAPAAHADEAATFAREGLRSYEKGEFEAALESFRRADAKKPGEPVIRYDLGAAQYKTGDFRSAESSFKEAAKSRDDRLRARSFYSLGNAYYRQDRLEDAIRSYEETLKIDPKDEDARKNLEFVKKKLEEKKQQPGQQQKNEPEQGRKQEQKPQPSQGQSKDQPKETKEQKSPDQKRAENILDRLEDKAAQTMRPTYGKRRVEKDW